MQTVSRRRRVTTNPDPTAEGQGWTWQLGFFCPAPNQLGFTHNDLTPEQMAAYATALESKVKDYEQALRKIRDACDGAWGAGASAYILAEEVLAKYSEDKVKAGD